ncbi:thioredoxin family protein [Filimonas effusa]|uniref:DUF255 domain-containing protein n=1 Tax=Filimonas effusa TaxID=2508721 RepID=A0A4Q1DCA5_9BACT|nr:thioredoxin fold domain-containing protein [Filimonas effusa]RXK87072.1 DUF255 domain-containing protein [Filimonas effusa]
MNKKLVTGAAMILWSTALFAQHRKIEFQSLTLAQACIKAAQENKLIFIDCYTSWCIPCKHMEANVFTVDSVADYFNSQFINLKMDMDKGEAVALGKKYQVGAYPSYLLVNKDSVLVSKFVGGMSAAEFISKTKAGTNPNNAVAVMNARYDAGERSSEFLRDYICQKIWLMEIAPAQKLNKDLMQQLSRADKAKPENWVLFGDNRYSLYLSDAGSENFNYLAEHWRDFSAIPRDTLNSKLSSIYRKIAGVFVAGRYNAKTNSEKYRPTDIPTYKKQIEGTELPDKKDLLLLMDISQAAVDKNTEKVTRLLAENVDTLSEKNKSIVFDYIAMCLSIPHYKYDGFGVIADRIVKTSTNPFLVNICKEYKQREIDLHAK